MSKSSCILLILCTALFCQQLGCQRTNQPVQPSSSSTHSLSAHQSAPVESADKSPGVTPPIQPSEPTAPPASPTPLIDLPEFDVSAVIFSKNQDWKVVVDGKPSAHGIFEHPPRDGKASVSFPLEGRCRLFKGAVAINDTAKDGNGSATPLLFVVEGDGKELWRSQPAQKCGETQPFSVDVSRVNRLTLVVECSGPYEYAHAVWLEPMLELNPGTRPFHETKEGREAAIAMIQRLGGTFVEEGRVAGNPIFEVNLIGTNATRDDLALLQGLVKLKHLYLGGNTNLDDDALAEIAPLSSLEVLHLSHNHWLTDKGFRHLARLRNLTRLDLGDTGVETITGSGLVHLAGLTRLKQLYLGNLHKLEARYFKDLAPLDNLEELYLSDCTGLGDDGLETLWQLDSLQFVDLVRSRVTDAGIKTIRPTPKLKYVQLGSTNTTEAGFAHLRKAGVAKYRVFGSAFLVAHYEPDEQIRDIVGLRFNFQVLDNQCTKPENWKISFMHHLLSKPGSPGFQQIDTNVFPNRAIYPHMIEAVPGKGWMKDGAQVNPTNVYGESSIAVGNQKGDGKSGCRSRSPEMFPTKDFELDYIPDNWARAHGIQRNLDGVPVAVEVKRGMETSDVTGFKRNNTLPRDNYRLWTATTKVEGQSYAVDFVFSSSSAEFFRPDLPTQISTEAFAEHPGLFRIVYWGLEMQRQGKTNWEPIRRWKLTVSDADPDENTWGFKRVTFQGRPAIEVSNDGTRTYLKKGEILELK